MKTIEQHARAAFAPQTGGKNAHWRYQKHNDFAWFGERFGELATRLNDYAGSGCFPGDHFGDVDQEDIDWCNEVLKR